MRLQYKASQLVLFTETIAIYFKNDSKHVPSTEKLQSFLILKQVVHVVLYKVIQRMKQPLTTRR